LYADHAKNRSCGLFQQHRPISAVTKSVLDPLRASVCRLPLGLLSQAYTLAAAEGGLRVPLETANQIAINALNLNNGYVRIRKGVIRSTKRCRSEFGISIRVALENEPYVVILL
jgi:hypothetical protein